VVDFSDPQRNGFVNAFVAYFLAQSDDYRSESQLRNVAGSLLEGCHYHFHKSIHQMARIGNIVSPDTKGSFWKLCDSLTTMENHAEFNHTVAAIQRQWPKASQWLSWWLAPDHAHMLFPSQRTMPENLADKLPDTTNAEEAMHATIYRIVGSLHNPLFQGLDGLLNVEKAFRMQTESALCK
ncbi:hypothetical protein GYMLUDRAFT_994919, partial [Collybiopsis luxurians FD-317 M1]